MKLSICIPVYNFDVGELVNSLRKEISAGNLDAEIILIDDASEQVFKGINAHTAGLADQFICLEKNLGRSGIRNLFLKYAKGDYLLFLDCDGKIIAEDFLRKYIDWFTKNPDTAVIYGGRRAQKIKPPDDHILRWNYAIKRENSTASVRQQKPYVSFQTNNFIIKKDIFSEVYFDENLLNYGYEDLLFAFDLQEWHIPITHINNEILNGDLESNEEFIQKIQLATQNIKLLLDNYKNRKSLSQIKLVKLYHLTKKLNLTIPFSWIFKLSKPLIIRQLKGGKTSIYLIDFYKLGYLLSL